MAETTWDYAIQDFSPLFLYSSSSGRASHQVASLDNAWSQKCPYEPAGPLNNSLCDVSSVHTTSVGGATVALTFHGQAVQFFGNVTGDLQFDVNVDGSITRGRPSGQLLASISGLAQGDHTVNLTVSAPSSGNLSLASALVTVGTGLTGANVTRTVVQDGDSLLKYGPGWETVLFNDWNIPHTANNDTWRQFSYTNAGSANISFSGSAVMVYGVSWSFFPTIYRMTLDTQQPDIYASSSSLQTSQPGRVYTNGLLYARTDLSEASHNLTFDNDNGAGEFGIDYVEIINVAGGSPITSSISSGSSSVPTHTTSSSASASRSHSVSVGVIVGPIVGVLALLLALAFIFCRRKPRNKERPSITPFHEDGSIRPPVAMIKPTDNGITSTGFMGTMTTTLPGTSSTGVSISAGGSPKGPRYGTESQSVASVFPEATTESSVNSPSPTTELRAIRRDIQQLMELVGQPRIEADGSPPDYAK